MLELTPDGLLNSWRWIAVDDRATIRGLECLYDQRLGDFIATSGEHGYDLGEAVPGFQEYWGSKQAYDLIFGP